MGRSVLILGAAERARIDELRAFARANPLNAEASVAAAKADIASFRDSMNPYSIELPRGWMVTYSQEVQPPGLCHHISVSIDRPGRAPQPAAMEMLLAAFGMQPLQGSAGIWVEHLGEGLSAVNVVQLVRRTA